MFPSAPTKRTGRSSNLARVAEVSDSEVSDRSHFKILSPKEMFERLPKPLHR